MQRLTADLRGFRFARMVRLSELTMSLTNPAFSCVPLATRHLLIARIASLHGIAVANALVALTDQLTISIAGIAKSNLLAHAARSSRAG
ncbi:hypothetical protein BH23CHL5_BH23CHL5_00530 [soil metagenome]